jgi:nicotinamide-nucleotide amidase
VRVELITVGTELLLGQIVNTNATVMAEHLASYGIECHFAQTVGDNHDRMVLALRTALARSDAAIVCGGLGPTQDDITREAVAEVMNKPLVQNPDVKRYIENLFSSKGINMPPINLRQADVPIGASIIPQTDGTAPGLICPMGRKVIYVLPGVPREMKDMLLRAVIPDLLERIKANGETVVMQSRILRTWGMSESALAQKLSPLIDLLDKDPSATTQSLTAQPPSTAPSSTKAQPPRATIAFLASGIEGIKVRITATASNHEMATQLLDRVEGEVRSIVGKAVFGIDDDTMESVTASLLARHSLTIALAESLTGGLATSRLVNVPGASKWLKGGITSYATSVKQELLSLTPGPVVSKDAAISMATHVADLFGADIGLSFTGVAGPDTQDDQPVGRVYIGLSMPNIDPEAIELNLPGDRSLIRQLAVISGLDLLRRRLEAANY